MRIAVTGLVDPETGTISAFDTADGDRRTNIPIADVIQDRFGLDPRRERLYRLGGR